MRKCELCECAARMYCESDQASLCWDCDEKVHCANFLVAKHSRSLLCHVCQSLTPWKASGSKLGPTVSVCDTCVEAARCGLNDEKIVREENQSERSSGGGHETETEDEDDYDDDDDDDDEEEEEDDDENQVVPWSGDAQSEPALQPPPLSSASCSSNSEEEVSLKRMRDFSDLYSDDEIGSSSHPGTNGLSNEEATTTTTSLSSYRPLKLPRTTTTISDQDHGQSGSRSTAIINSLHRLQNKIITNEGDASAAVIGICRLSRDNNR